MAQTINEQREAADRAAALAELRRQRSEVATRLAGLDRKIATLDESDHLARVGDRKISELSRHEQSEYVTRHGADEFERMVLNERR
jgi:hypothetical protein